jgi:acyl-CoA thioesterase
MTTLITDLLSSDGQVDALDQASFNGFDGMHGGLTVALLLRRMRALVPQQRGLVTVTARFIRPLRGPITLDVNIVRAGGSVTIAHAAASSPAGTSVYADALYGSRSALNTPVFSPDMPSDIVGRPDAEVFAIPPEFIPISERMEIRPAAKGLPYSGSDVPVLCAWVRLKEDVPANDERMAILADALAPSYTAVLTELKTVPTVEMSVQLSPQALDFMFDWVLLRAQTTIADTRGFVRETIDIWAEDGLHLATCTQARIIR